MIKKLSKILIIAVLLLLPTGGLFRVKIADNIHILPQDFFIFFLFLIVIFIFTTRREKPVEKEFVLFSLVFVSTGAISLFVNGLMNPAYNLIVSSLYPIRYLMYLSIFFYPLIFSGKKLVNDLLFFSGSAVVIIGFLQYFYYNNLGNLSYLGWDDHLYRLFSTFLDPNFVGIFYVLFLGFLINRIESIKNIIKKRFETIIFCLTFFAVFLTYSRSAFITLVCLLITLLIILEKKIFYIFPVLFISFSMLLLLADFKVEGLNPIRTVSSIERIKSVQNASHIFLDNPILGIGFNAYRYAQIEYGFRNVKGSLNSNADAGTDNSFLFVLATTGVIGFASFIAAYYYLLSRLIKVNKVYFSVIISIFIGSLFINALFYTPILTFLFFMLAYNESTKDYK